MASSIKTSVKMIATLRVWCWISLKIRLCPEAFLCPKLGNCLFQIQGVSELLWCIKLSYFAENRWCPNINGVRKYMVNMVWPFFNFEQFSTLKNGFRAISFGRIGVLD